MKVASVLTAKSNTTVNVFALTNVHACCAVKRLNRAVKSKRIATHVNVKVVNGHVRIRRVVHVVEQLVIHII